MGLTFVFVPGGTNGGRDLVEGKPLWGEIH